RGFAQSVSLDLIFGVPGESLANWQGDLEQALALAPDHISTYGLTFEKGTAFWSRLMHGELRKSDEETERQMYESAIDTLSAAGFEHYEVSNFARPGRRCRHNEVYWANEAYFGFGLGAARYVQGRRDLNRRDLSAYIQHARGGRSVTLQTAGLDGAERARETPP